MFTINVVSLIVYLLVRSSFFNYTNLKYVGLKDVFITLRAIGHINILIHTYVHMLHYEVFLEKYTNIF